MVEFFSVNKVRFVKYQQEKIEIMLVQTDYFTDMLKPLGLRVNYIMEIASFAELQQISEAAATTTFCHTLGSYMATALEEKFGVPQIKASQPYGIKGTDEWLRAIAKTVGKEAEAEEEVLSPHAVKERTIAPARKIPNIFFILITSVMCFKKSFIF